MTHPLRFRTLAVLLGLLSATPTQAQPATSPATVPASAPVGGSRFPIPTTPAPAGAIPREQLDAMYRRELGERYDPAAAERYYQTHLWLERYFATDSPEDHKAILSILGRVGLGPDAVGRLCRLRINWPELAGGVYTVNERVGPYAVHYFLGVPKDYDRTRPWPLVVRLPSAAPFVGENPPDADEVVRIYTAWVNEELKAHPDALVLMPLLNLRELWGPSYAGMNSVMQPIFHAAGRANVDGARVYLVGHSMSAHAVWNLALHYPTYFAAINPLAGGAGGDWQRVRMLNLRNVLPVVWHDADDKVVKVESSRALVRILRSFRYEVDYTETKGVGHVPADEMVEKCYGKMRARARELYPKEVALRSDRPDVIFNRVDWVQVDQPLDAGGERKLLIRHGSGPILLNDRPVTLEASLKGDNHVEVKSANVEIFRLYLNDQMVDFARPVTVTVNGRVRFAGVVKPGLEGMLNDQRFVGRGWRYFTGVVEIDFGDAATTGPATRPAGGLTTGPAAGSPGEAERKAKVEEMRRYAEEVKRQMREENGGK